jgi:hypothetical protein
MAVTTPARNKDTNDVRTCDSSHTARMMSKSTFTIIPSETIGSNKQAVAQLLSTLGVEPPTIRNQTGPVAKTTTGNPKAIAKTRRRQRALWPLVCRRNTGATWLGEDCH